MCRSDTLHSGRGSSLTAAPVLCTSLLSKVLPAFALNIDIEPIQRGVDFFQVMGGAGLHFHDPATSFILISQALPVKYAWPAHIDSSCSRAPTLLTARWRNGIFTVGGGGSEDNLWTSAAQEWTLLAEKRVARVRCWGICGILGDECWECQSGGRAGEGGGGRGRCRSGGQPRAHTHQRGPDRYEGPK